MTRLVLAAVVLCLSGTAAAANWPRTLAAPGPVTALAADSRRVAFVVGRSAGDCDRVRIWSLQTRRVAVLGRRTSCVETSTGRGIAALALVEDRALWLHYTGGNIREWTLWTATPTKPTPVRLRALSRDVDDPSPIVVGNGDGTRFGDLLPYAVDSEVVVIRASGARRFAWTAPGRVVALATAYGETAVATEDGTVTVLDASGRPLATEAFSRGIEAMRLTGNRIVVQRGRTLEQRGATGPATFLLPRGARLVDAFGDRVLYVGGTDIRELRLTDGSSRMVANGSGAQAALATLYLSDGKRLSARPLR